VNAHTEACARRAPRPNHWPPAQPDAKQAQAVLACPHPTHDVWKFVHHGVPMPKVRA
jgi:hypothetical protein